MYEDKRFLNSKDVSEIIGKDIRTAEKIIKNLNSELSKKGYLIITGRVINTYFYERYFGKDET